MRYLDGDAAERGLMDVRPDQDTAVFDRLERLGGRVLPWFVHYYFCLTCFTIVTWDG